MFSSKDENLLKILPALITLFLCLNNCEVSCFSASVPPLKSVCTNMLPHHDTYKPQSGEAPYKIYTSSNSVAGGSDVIVSLNATQFPFKGFYMQARDENSKPIGSFATNSVAKTHSCNGVRSNSAHHANGKIEKMSGSVTWTAPKGYTGDVIFISTFVKDYVNIWAGVYSEPVTVTPYINKRSNTRSGSLVSNILRSFGIRL